MMLLHMLQDANALMLGEFPVVMDLVGSVEAAKEAKQQVVMMVMRVVMVVMMKMLVMMVVIRGAFFA